MTQMVSIDDWSKENFTRKQQDCIPVRSCGHKKLA